MKQMKRILALAGVVLLVILYIATLLCALFDSSSGMVLFKISVICTILIPVLLWGYTVIYRLAKGKTDQELELALNQIDSDQIKAEKDQKNGS